MSLLRIPSDVEKKISACGYINNFKKAIEELVYNALDAKATSVAIRVFIQESSIQVIDNGCGISYNDFQFLGRRYMTSKFQSTSLEEPIQSYGYKGLSLANIIDVSQKVKITSRCNDTENTFTKIFIEGKEQDISKTTTRPSKGTNVEISGFLYNLHIQKSTINQTTEIARIRSFLEQISLIHCNTSISLRDDSINEIIFQIKKHRDIYQTLSSLFEIESKEIQELQVEKNEYKIHGFIEKLNEGYKNYNFIYVNGRFINNSKLHYSINKKLRINDLNRITKTKKDNFKAEKITNKNIPFYFIFIKCPPTDYDISYTSEEIFIEFKNWEKIDKLVEKLVKFYNGDLVLKKINGDCKRTIEETNKDTRIQVKEIMQKILGNNSKKNKKGLRIQAGIIGKNVKRKQNNKATEMSISKIVSKQLKPKQNKFNKINILCKSNNSILSNNQIDLTASRVNKNKFLSIKSRNETRIETDFSHSKENKDIQKTCENDIRISQDRLNMKFKNPTDSVLKRCNILLDELKHFFPDKPNHNVASTNEINNRVKYIANYTVQKETNVTIKNHNYIYNDASDIKTSYDLVRSIFNSEDVSRLNLANKREEKQSEIKHHFMKNSTTHKTYKHKLSYESHKYTEIDPPKKEKRFISNSSCNNFQIHKNQLQKSFVNKIHKKRKYSHSKNHTRQEVRNKATRDLFFHKNLYQSIQTIETIESHYNKNISTIFSNIEDKSYLSHRSKYDQFTSNLQQTFNSKEIVSSKMKTNLADNDLHKTYTIEVSSNKDCYYLNNEIQPQEIDINNIQYNNANIIFVSEPNPKNISQSINPLQVCETIFQISDLKNSTTVRREDFDITNKNLCNSRLNEISDESKQISQYFTNEESILSTNNTSDTNIKDKMLDTIETGKNISQEQILEVTNKKSPFEGNVDTDTLNKISEEGFKLNSRFTFIPKGMSQITAISLPKVNYRNTEENYYENDIYENFATNLQIFSEILEPGVQNLNDLTTKGIRSVVCKPNDENIDPIFDATSLKAAKVLGQVDYKFIGAKVTGKYSKHNLTSEFLVLFDQHAVDERIRLENNLSDYFDGEKWMSITVDALPLKLSKEFTTYLHNYKEKFTRFGLEWSFKDDVVLIKSIPKAILGKNSRQIDVIMKAVKSLIYEQVEAIKSLKGNVSLHPKSIMDLVLSEACRYSIKFGDILTKAECQNLLSSLSTCKLPFQCAHGRPVMAVMMELPVLSDEYKVNMDKMKRFNSK